MQFFWDPNKARSNVLKHGVSFVEATSALCDPLSITGYDPDHSTDEDRYVTFGQDNQCRLLVVSHTEESNKIRIISCRSATLKERKIYETA